MILGSHNSWSYLSTKDWYMKPFRFIAQCQDLDIKQQYELGVRCFDLRVQFDKKNIYVVHGFMKFKISFSKLCEDLEWLSNREKQVYIRILHDARSKKLYNLGKDKFMTVCYYLLNEFPNLKFWCGRNLYNWNVDYKFEYNPSCKERYDSVSGNKFAGLNPRAYAKKHNNSIYNDACNEDILLMDFVNYINL